MARTSNAAKAPSKEVAKVADAGLPALSKDAFAGAGTDDLGSGDLRIPFIKVLNALSPEIETMEGARAGLICIGNQSLAESVDFVPYLREHCYMEWVPINDGGGLVAKYKPDDEHIRPLIARQKFGAIQMENGNELIETFYVYGFALTEDGNWYDAVVSFKSTGIKHYQNWMGLTKQIAKGHPMFGATYRLSAVKEKKDKNTWYNLTASYRGKTARDPDTLPNYYYQRLVEGKDASPDPILEAAFQRYQEWEALSKTIVGEERAREPGDEVGDTF